MAGWEYEMVWTGDTGFSGLRDRVRGLGDEGWELTHACAVAGTLVVLLRRPADGGGRDQELIDLLAERPIGT